ncbi:MAG: hypothetical protein Q7T04_04945 [Dehalococcoidia bacterium]|nr:hypothetical protein [Dehalococcoidia bacterium]
MSTKIHGLNDFLLLLKSVKPGKDSQFMALCPGHDDKKRSLSIKQVDCKLLIKCFAGCDIVDILKPLNLEPKDLFLNSHKSKPEHREIESVYHYDGFEVVRTRPKGFYQRRPDGNGGYINNVKGVKLSLYHQDKLKQAIDSGTPIFVVEGEKDCDNLWNISLVSTTNPMGAGKWRDSYTAALRGADLIIIPDNDGPGRDHANNVAKSCYGKAARIRVIELPGNVKDVSEWLHNGHTVNELAQLTSKCSDYEPPAYTTLPIIAVGNRQLRDLTADGLKALEAANNPKPNLFRFGSGLARIGHDDRHGPFTEQASETIIRYQLSKCATFTRYDAEGNAHNCLPPLELSRNILVAGADWAFPSLLGIVEAPTLRPDFTVLSTPGYDAQTGLYLEHSRQLAIPQVPERPTDSELQNAVNLILEVFCDFPFVDQASRANMTAAILLSCVRDAITGPVPLTLVTKPQPGCGGSLLIDSVAIVATGVPAQMIPATRDPEEWRKLLTSLLLSGARYVMFDNLDHTLESEYLAAFLTALIWKDRLLGQSQPIQLPNRTICFANGNNVRVGGNLARRIVPVLLDSPEARPWLRDASGFKHPKQREWVTENRGRIIAAILTVVRGWVLAGKHTATDIVSLGSFESYAEVVGNLLAFMGVKGFLGNLEELYAKIDVDTPVWANFFEVWLGAVGPEPITVADLVSRLRDNTTLRAALPDFVSNMEDKGYTRRLGNQLAKREGQKFDNGLTLIRGEKFRKAVMWKIESFKNKTHTNLALNVCFESFNVSLRGGDLENKEIGNKECIGPIVNSQNSQTCVESESLVPDALGMTID